ncbi:Na+/H+ antiporter NhaC family protein [Saccharicrinis aurantiacus]|uniref:Na+/H+ antiporter NhaC family protein n=1 Tax=Saccharicrinis aurantiacus TaxID=1849719 RepID=UPI00248FD93E|nr:Na+/H+ antiporter NhaC family protein [Saccharicrinis aurantiacus]
MDQSTPLKKKWLALLPIVIFLLLYLVSSIVSGDFYKMPVTVSFFVASLIALAMNRKRIFSDRVETYLKGMGDSGIMMMCLIFILAGVFATLAKNMGAVSATVNLGITYLPPNILVAGLFLIGCFISLSVGTSLGTVVALTPVGMEIADQTGVSLGLTLGAVLGGAMFGDNLSFISDTTIAAARTQGAKMKDKFRVNFFIVLPAAVITFLLYLFLTKGTPIDVASQEIEYQYLKIVPYLFVLIAALAGMNVFIVLVIGSILSAIIGFGIGAFDFWGIVNSIGDGIDGMSEIIIISILVGGMVALIRYNGGIDWIIKIISRNTKGRRSAEFSIAALTSVVNVFTANNTITILIVGPIAKDIAQKFGIKPRRAASILDTFSCFMQGLLPYGAQILAIIGLTHELVSPFEIMNYLFYPYLMGISSILAITFGLPKLKEEQ